MNSKKVNQSNRNFIRVNNLHETINLVVYSNTIRIVYRYR
jgi:hypothetical protein